MAVMTLAEVKKGMQDDVLKGVIDEFIKGDYLFQMIPFNFIANRITGGAGWAISYVYLTEESKTGFRDINGQYTDTMAKKETKRAEVKIYGGSFKIDRALRDQGGVENEVAFQMGQLIKAIKKGFSYSLINGSLATDSKSFDGLDVLLKGTKTDMNAHTTGFDLSTFVKVKENALEFASKINEFLSLLDEKPHALLGNSLLINKIKDVARITGQYTKKDNEFGETVDHFDNIPLEVLGTYAPEGATAKETIDIDGTGNTCLYAVRFGKDALQVASPDNGKAFDVILPDFSQASEQVRGMVELRGVPIIVHSKSCGVLRKIKVK